MPEQELREPELKGRVALVTGGSRGIGRAIALRLAESGARVAVNYAANAEAAEETERQIAAVGGEARLYRADVGSEEETNAMYDQIEADLGPVELLVTNAGIARSGDALSMGSDIWREIMQVNLHGTFHCVWRAKDKMLERQFGRIVCISSILGLRRNRIAPERLIAYGTSKAAINGFVRSTAAALGPHVRMNGVAPGYIATDMTADVTPEAREMIVNNTPLKRVGEGKDIADLVHYLLSEQSGFVTGHTHVAAGGMEL